MAKPDVTLQVIGAGFGRTGTTSFNRALEILYNEAPSLDAGLSCMTREEGMIRDELLCIATYAWQLSSKAGSSCCGVGVGTAKKRLQGARRLRRASERCVTDMSVSLIHPATW